MMNNSNSAFWREVLDFVPYLTLLFRIEEDESAHVIFANQEIQHQLLYRPQDYVLEGESDTGVKRDLDSLIDKIADQSHRTQREKEMQCELYDRQGNVHAYSFDFRIFQTRVGRTNLILVTLMPETNGTSGSSRKTKLPELPRRVGLRNVWQSDVMQAILDKIPEYRLRGSNLLIRGEHGTGRKTLARYLAEHLSGHNDEIFEFHLDKSEDKQREQLFGEESHGSNLLGNLSKSPEWQQSPVICLVISDLAELSELNIHRLAGSIRQRNERKVRTRIIAISEVPLEKIVDRLGSLYYELNFYPILMPGLKHRKEDIRVIARNWLEHAAEAIGLENLTVSEKELAKLGEYEWPGNFSELFHVLRQSLLSADGGLVHFRTGQLRALSTIGKDSGEEIADILSFDEMNRRYLKKVLELTDGKIYGNDGAASLLGLKPTTLQSKLKKLKVK